MSDLRHAEAGDLVRDRVTGEAYRVTVAHRDGWRVLYEIATGDAVRYDLRDGEWVETERVRASGDDAAP